MSEQKEKKKTKLREKPEYNKKKSETILEKKTEEKKKDNEKKEQETEKDPFQQMRHNIGDFLRLHRCYTLIPLSAKIVVIDTKLPLKHTFQALAEHQFQSVPLWDSQNHRYVGMYTVTDVVDVLCHYYTNNKIDQLGETTVEDWRGFRKIPERIVGINPETTMFDALYKLSQKKFHRLPVIDPQSPSTILYVIKHLHLLRFVVKSLELSHKALQKSIREIGVARTTNLITTTPQTPVIDVLKIISEKRISGIPIVDKNFKLIDRYSRSDITDFVVTHNLKDLTLPVSEAIMKRRNPEEEYILHTCNLDDSYADVLIKIAELGISRLFCVDEDYRLTGVVSLTDIMNFFVLETEEKK
ncbi:hypothetical protein M0812_12458 [Anaeramoeba flamelloides]|uniref:CBS domain-containing protein n=1 Tax=Anaeramoeba flamelloides TaxID=1746091 RepID=A0AAV7ZQS2_9EUKA|nr:hypothetical protein M0812_12458 [Anaeramoeba flamelloides]